MRWKRLAVGAQVRAGERDGLDGVAISEIRQQATPGVDGQAVADVIEAVGVAADVLCSYVSRVWYVANQQRVELAQFGIILVDFIALMQTLPKRHTRNR